MLYTKKGDKGTTTIFSCDQRISKSSKIAEALGALDELNSFLGICKTKTRKNIDKMLIDRIQNNLFIIQAQVAGADKLVNSEETKHIENIIDKVESKLTKIDSFIVPGANEISAFFDFVRTIARRAERRVVDVDEEKKVKIDNETLIFLNRLSSLFYALARHAAQKTSKEKTPKY